MFSIKDILIAPSINALFFTGFLILTIFVIVIRNFNRIINLNYYQQLMLLSSISIAVGMHGMIHSVAETNFGFNPYNWF